MGRGSKKLVAALAALVAFVVLGVMEAPATANDANSSNQYTKLKKQRDNQIKKCNKQVRNANKRLRKAKKTRNKARIRKANRQVRTAKKKRKNCANRARVSYRKKLKNFAPQHNTPAPYSAKGSVGEAYVTGASPGAKLMLVNGNEKTIANKEADSYGSAIFYDMKPGKGYSVRTRINNKKVQGTKKFEILRRDDNPNQSFYDQKTLNPGLNYVTMRDGVELAMTVRLPAGKTMAEGPFPTFIEHSGYQTAAPHDLLNSIIGGLGGGPVTSDPLAPLTSTAVGSLIGPQMGFAVVSVQMRGSGCSGGAFDLFGLPTTYDGYDMVETVAAQDWVKGGKVGMGGISFSGLTQLYAAGTKPPHLAAISPMSVTNDIYQGTGFPGGIFNNGFAYTWITDRAKEARPAPEFGQPWAKVMSTTGDPDITDPNLRAEQKQHCLDNQKLRLQTRDYNQEIENNPYRTPLLFDDRAPAAWMDRIDVPVFLAGQFQDEQTGAHFPEAISALKGKKDVYVVLQNGVHVDSLGPSVITQWVEFMNLFVADEVPKMPGLLVALSGTLYGELADAGALPIQESDLIDMPNAAAALAKFRQDNPRVRVLMDNGNAVPGDPGAIGADWGTSFSDWPIPSLTPTTYNLGASGEMTAGAATGGESSYVSDPAARPARTLGENAEGDSWLAQPPYDWQPVAAGKGLGWTSSALANDVFIAGPSSLDLYLKSSKADTDLQVTLTEVRPDGKETYVQNGWLRASHRKIDPKLSTANNPVQGHLEADSEPLEAGKFNLTRVQIFPVAHVFRAGSKIRVNVQAPGGDRTIWNFDTIEKGDTQNTIGFGGATPSKLVLPVIPGQTAQGTDLPGPTALRGQPSREFVEASNGG